jgi:hypothetical protein
VAEEDSFALPAGDADALPSSQSGWARQVRWDEIRRALGIVGSALTSRSFAKPVVLAVAALMLVAPVVIFCGYLSMGVLLLSPPLIATFLGGFVGLGLTRSEHWERQGTKEKL